MIEFAVLSPHTRPTSIVMSTPETEELKHIKFPGSYENIILIDYQIANDDMHYAISKAEEIMNSNIKINLKYVWIEDVLMGWDGQLEEFLEFHLDFKHELILEGLWTDDAEGEELWIEAE